MSKWLFVRGRRWDLLALLCLAILFCLLLLGTITQAPPAEISLAFGDTKIWIRADRAWTLFPGDCVKVKWELEGIESVYVDGAGKIGRDEILFCPAINATRLKFEVTAANGIYRDLDLEIRHLPNLLLYLAGFVGLVGTPLLALYFFLARQVSRPPPVKWILIAVLLLGIVGAWQRLQPTRLPLMDVDDGDIALRFWAETDRIVFPHECVAVGWSVVGAETLRFNDVDVTARGGTSGGAHCAEAGDAASLEIVDGAGVSNTYTLSIPSLFPYLRWAPAFSYVSIVGILLGVVVFGPLAAAWLREYWRRWSKSDQLALLGCVSFVFLLYLPFGFDSAGHWEEWIIHGYAEGGTLSFYRTETVSRFFVTIPHTLAYLISSESFLGYHIVNFSLYTLEMVFLYGILRLLGVAPLYAFLMTILFLVYPVNSSLMTLRRLPKNFSVMTILLATLLMLDYCRRPRRLALLGVWLALMYSVYTNETGFAVILFVPLLWWLRNGSWDWRKVTLTASWYLVPAFKVAYVILLLLTNREFYQSGLLEAETEAQEVATPIIETFLQVMGEVYRQTFVEGWREAIGTLAGNPYWLVTALMVIGVGGVAWLLARESSARPGLLPRQSAKACLGGLLVIIASVGILMWFPLYRNDPWRMYLVVPVGAAVAMVSLILLVIARIREVGVRNVLVIALSLLLLIPAASRLVMQLDHFTESAHRKARILQQVVRLAPGPAADTQFAMVTEMDNAALLELGVFELIHNDMLNSALYVLYRGAGPEYSYFCSARIYCGDFSGEQTIYTSAATGELLQRTLVFRLNSDLSVELLEDPAAYLGIESDLPYDASRLYAADVPLPSRVDTMLGAAG